MARGDDTEASDIDLLVSIAPTIVGLGIGGLQIEVQELLGRKDDQVTENSIYHLRDRVLSETVPH